MIRRGLVLAVFAVACVGSDPDTTPAVDGGTPDASTGGDASTSDVVTVADAGSDVDANDSGPFDPNYFGHLELWLKADEGVVLADGGPKVATWADHSAAARTVSVPTTGPCTNGPTVLANGLHNLPLVHFDGSTQCLGVSGEFKDFTNGLTVFSVFQPENCNSQFTGTSGALFDSHDNSMFDYRDGLTVGRNPTPANNGSGDALLTITNGTNSIGQVGITGGASWVPGTAELLTFHLPPGASTTLVAGTAYVNGTFKDPNPNDPLIPLLTNGRTTTYVGYRDTTTSYPFYCGGIGEFLVYSKGLADADRAAVEAHLKTRWGL